MDGIGISTLKKGKEYRGEYKQDKRHGFGIYTWSDGRTHSGYWWKGKEHGLGTSHIQGGVEGTHTLWEDGKKVAWFTQQQVNIINLAAQDSERLNPERLDSSENTFDYRTYFQKEKSASKVDADATFDAPSNFYLRLELVEEQIETRKALSKFSPRPGSVRR